MKVLSCILAMAALLGTKALGSSSSFKSEDSSGLSERVDRVLVHNVRMDIGSAYEEFMTATEQFWHKKSKIDDISGYMGCNAATTQACIEALRSKHRGNWPVF